MANSSDYDRFIQVSNALRKMIEAGKNPPHQMPRFSLYVDEQGKVKPTNTGFTSNHRDAVLPYLLTDSLPVEWSDIIGNDFAKEQIRLTFEAMTTYKKLANAYGVSPASGLVLHGPPGCGKTMFGKALAHSLKLPNGKPAEMLVINGSELQQEYVGQTEKLLKVIFAYAKDYHEYYKLPLILFFDEADAFLLNRNTAYGYESRNVSTFLSLLDGVAGRGSVFTILATNRLNVLDPAVIRPGRIDYKIEVKRPTQKEVIAQLDLLISKNKKIECSGKRAASFLYNHDGALLDLSKIYTNSDKKPEIFHLTLPDILTGAVVADFVNRAVRVAFNEAIALGQNGPVVDTHFALAADQLYAENVGIMNESAIRDFVERHDLTNKKQEMN